MHQISAIAKKPAAGVYRAVLIIDELKGTELPFNFKISYKGKKPLITILNADESINVDEITIKKDSFNFKMPVFDTEFRTRIVDGGLEGYWINHYRTTKNRIRFVAKYNEARRFLFAPAKNNGEFEGRWEVTFSPGNNDSTKAIGIFRHQELTDFVNGTFLTETGDYRYLEGMKHGNELYMSCFDGSHAFLFTAEYKDGKFNGRFYSGSHWSEPWVAVKNENFALKDANNITFITGENEPLDFSFRDNENNIVTLSDKPYAGKPVIVQLMGSWCPNCMDESRYLADLYTRYKSQGLEIIGLCFEKTTDYIKASQQVSRMKKKLNIEYKLLITEKTGKEMAGALFKNLNAITAFPTTLFLDRDHRIVRIHTGFSGPATGAGYDKFRQETESLADKLLTR